MKNRTIYFDYLRVFSTLAVVFIHVSTQKWYSSDINSLAWKTFTAYDSVVRWCVPVFVMISGALFLGKAYDIKKIYSKNVLRLATAYIFWSVIYALIEGGGKSTIISNIIIGHYHMWFIPMIAGLYICIPFIHRIAQDNKLTKYFLAVAFVFAFVLPTFLQLLNDFGGEHAKTLYNALRTVIADINLQFVMGYTAYFIAGYFLKQTELSPKARRIIYLLGVAAGLFTVLISIYISLKNNKGTSQYFNNFYVNIMLESIAVFVWVKYNAHLFKRLDRFVAAISPYCFGAYLVHVIILDTLNKNLHINTLSFHPVLSVPVISVVVFIVSMIISAVINQIPVLKKYIV